MTDALNHSTGFVYNPEGRISSKTDPLGHAIQYAYDDSGRVISETDSLGQAKTFAYDSVGNRTQQKDALNNTVFSGTYDSVGNLLTATDALNQVTQHAYDTLNRLTGTTDPLNHATSFGYDDLDRLVQATDALNGQSSISYDWDGNRASITDQNSQQTGFAFDLSGRIASITSAAGNTKGYQYNSRDLTSTITNGRQQAATVVYDDAGRITSITDPAGTISYTYDTAGNILTVSDGSGTLTRQYDAAGRLTQYTDGSNNTISYGYDSANRLTTLTYPGGRQVTYGYDNANRLTTVTDWASRQTQYGYDANNRLTTVTRPDGSHQSYTYDAKGQVTVSEDRDSQNAVIVRYEYTYDAAGNIATETASTGSGHVETNTYNAIDRLAAQSVVENGIPTENYSYTYDAGGNVLSATNNGVTTTFTYGSANRIATMNGQTVTYDADGNITSAPLGGTPTSLTFDSRNRLTAVGAVSYGYNAENQRISKTENGQTTNYVINPNAPLYQNMIKTTGGVSTYYVYGLGLIAQETGTDYKTYHYDLRGSTVALTDAAGLVTDTYNYGPYGEVLSHTGTSQVDYQFNGRDGVVTDSNGLNHMRARYYSPELRRFLNEDDFAGKYDDILNVNLYGYCEENPVVKVDPSGQDSGTAGYESTKKLQSTADPKGLIWIYDVMYGDNFKTLKDPHASKWQKAAALAALVPAGKLGMAGTRIVAKAGKELVGIGPDVLKIAKNMYKSVGNAERARIGKSVTPLEKTYEMALDPEIYANAVAKKYGINLRGSGQSIEIKFNPALKCAGKSRQATPNIIEIGPSALSSEDELANTIAHELNHARSWLKGGNAPESTAYPAGDSLSKYINGGQ